MIEKDRYMSNSCLSALGSATAYDIRELKEPGLILPVRKHDEPLLITRWDDKMYAMMLKGGHAYTYFPVSLQSPHTGLFISKPEILVDFSSAANGAGCEEHGTLILAQDELSVIGMKAGDAFGLANQLPLWKEIKGGSAAAKVAFARWGLGAKEGDSYRVLWERERSVQKSAVEFS